MPNRTCASTPTTAPLTATDLNLAYAALDPNQGANPNVTGSAYSNNFIGTATTTLYGIDSNLDILVTQNPPNNGTLNTVGLLGVDTLEFIGFDISGESGTAFASLVSPMSVRSLFTIDLATGTATLVGTIGDGTIPIRGLTVVPPTVILLALTEGNNLLAFDAASPGNILVTIPISGLGGDDIIGIDLRPATQEVFALSSANRLYMIDLTTGEATQVGADGAFTLSGTDFGFDFNPVPDRIRVVSDAEQNLRLNPNDGTLTATDTNLAYAVGDPNQAANPNVVGSAYANNIAGVLTTTLYGIDSNLDILVTQNPPNNGTLNTVGPLGVDTSGLVGFDITTGTRDMAFAALTAPGAADSQLYGINLTTGAASSAGTIGGGELIRALTAIGVVPQFNSGSDSNGCSIAGSSVLVGQTAVNFLIPLIPAFAIGFRILRRGRKEGKK